MTFKKDTPTSTYGILHHSIKFQGRTPSGTDHRASHLWRLFRCPSWYKPKRNKLQPPFLAPFLLLPHAILITAVSLTFENPLSPKQRDNKIPEKNSLITLDKNAFHQWFSILMDYTTVNRKPILCYLCNLVVIMKLRGHFRNKIIFTLVVIMFYHTQQSRILVQ